jgi:hypothetical protein
MTSKEFVIWLKGFTEGVHEYNITPKQWDTLKEKLAELVMMKELELIGVPNGEHPNCHSHRIQTHLTTTPGTSSGSHYNC